MPVHRPVSLNLWRLASASRAYLEVCRAVMPDIAAMDDAGLLRDQLNAALRPTEFGTPAAVMDAVAPMVGLR